MKIEKYNLDRWYIIPTIVYYNNAQWDTSKSIELAWFNKSMAFEWKKK